MPKKKINSSGNVFNLQFSKQVEGAPVTKNSNLGWIKNGQDNLYPNHLLELYQNSPTHHAAVNFEVQSVVGEGVDYDAMGIDGSQVFPNYQYSWDILIRNIALDYFLYGAYAVEVIKNKDGKTFSFYSIPYEKVRCSPYDEDGVITSYYVCNDWSSPSTNKPIRLDAIDMRDSNVIKSGKPYIYVYNSYDPTTVYYQSPIYSAGIKAIQAEIQFINYDLRSVINGFTPTGAITLPEMSTEEEKKAVIQNIANMFTGSENANSIVITFRSNTEDKPIEFTPFSTQGQHVDLYAESNLRTQARILAAHQIPSASLCGLPDIGNNGFSSEADKLETAFQLYERLTGNYHRLCIIKVLNDMFKLNGIEVEVKMKPVHFNDFGETDGHSPSTNATSGQQNVDSDNIEEQVN